MIADALVKVRGRIAQACSRCGRDPKDITLVAVVKGRSVQDIRQALDAGITVIGENRIQEARSHSQQLPAPKMRFCWHMIGHLQTNKAKEAVGSFDLIHSVDSLRLARAVDKAASSLGKVQDILLEVNTSGEASKFGIAPAEAGRLCEEISALGNLRLCGLMTVAAVCDDPQSARGYFRQLRSLLEDLRSGPGGKFAGLKVLSMGMSDDFEVAIEEGATMIRLGRAIFQS